MDFSASKVLDNHKSVLTSFGKETSDDELDLPFIYWILKMHKIPYKHRFIAGSSKWSTKPLNILLTKLLTHIKQDLQKYSETAYSRSGINQMLILKNSKELLEHLKFPTFNHETSIKSFDFFTLYTTIPHRNAFIFKNGNRRYKYLVLGHEGTYFVKEHSDSKIKNMYSEDDIKMLEFLIDNIFVFFCRKSLPADSRHSNGYELCPASRRHLSVFIRSGFHTVFALNGKDTFSISVQSQLQVHRWCFVHKQPRIRKLSGPDVSCWTWDQGHHREPDFCFLPRFTLSIGRDFTLRSTTNEMISISTSQTFRSWIVIFHLRQPMDFLSLNLYDTPGLAPRVNVLHWGPGDFPVSHSNRDTSRERLKSSFRKFYGRYGDLIQQ